MLARFTVMATANRWNHDVTLTNTLIASVDWFAYGVSESCHQTHGHAGRTTVRS